MLKVQNYYVTNLLVEFVTRYLLNKSVTLLELMKINSFSFHFFAKRTYSEQKNGCMGRTE